MADVLILGGIAFDDFSTPETMMGGGAQTMVVHKLPGGARVIDTLGPDEAEVTWRGQFFGNDAYDNALALDAMRAAGLVVPLIWGGQFRSVVIQNFVYRVRRLPAWVEYEIACTVARNPMLGDLTSAPPSFDGLVSADLGNASSAGADATVTDDLSAAGSVA
jgi:hypothetical protein